MCVSIQCVDETNRFFGGKDKAGRPSRPRPAPLALTAVHNGAHPPHLACCPITLMSDPGDALAKSKFYRRLFRLPANEVLLNGACIDV